MKKKLHAKSITINSYPVTTCAKPSSVFAFLRAFGFAFLLFV